VGALGIWEDGSGRRFNFQYSPEWLANPERFPISVKMPIGQEVWGDEAHRFVQNLLPEGAAREAICSARKIGYDDDVALLEALGGDTAGALVFLEGEEVRARNRRALEIEDLAQFSKGLVVEQTSDEPIRLSLAGAQHKTTVVIKDDGYFWPASDEASTHILKFDSPRFPHLSVNEFFVMELARRLELPVAPVKLDFRAEQPFLVVDRYDRLEQDSETLRLHQEDFCQILGLAPRQKYTVGIERVVEAIREYSIRPALDIRSIVRWIVFNVLAGNSDGHAKNLSMVRSENGLRLAPFYDLVCTRHYKGIDRMLAMPVGSNRDSDSLTVDDWRALAGSMGIQVRLIRGDVERMVSLAPDLLPKIAEEMIQMGCQLEETRSLEHQLKKRLRSFQATLKSALW